MMIKIAKVPMPRNVIRLLDHFQQNLKEKKFAIESLNIASEIFHESIHHFHFKMFSTFKMNYSKRLK